MFDKKVTILTGKGGVGKSTLSLAAALFQEKKGKKCLLIDFNSSGSKGKILDGNNFSEEITKIRGNIFGINLVPKNCLTNFITHTLKFKAISNLIINNSILGYFFRATPGLDEFMMLWQMTEIINNEKDFDHFIIDAPATGHGLTLLKVPFVFEEIFRIGRLNKMTKNMITVLEEKNLTEIIIVTIPEELPYSETLELYEKFKGFPALCLGGILLNKVFPEIPHKNSDIFRNIKKLTLSDSDKLKEFLNSYDKFFTRAEMRKDYFLKFKENLPLEILELPYFFTAKGEVDAIKQVSNYLEQKL